MNRGRGLALLLAALAIPAIAAGQQSASLTATAVITSTPLTVTRLRDLNFGTVPRGIATTVRPNAAGAGEFQVTGLANARVIISFVLPTQLNNIQAAPGSTMPIAFLYNSARWRRANNNPNGGTTFNPATGAVGRLGPPANPTMYIWLGGRVNPAANAKPGIYTGTVVVNLVYQ
jgi:hypothetical protein